MLPRMSQTSNTPWWLPPSSRSTATDKAQSRYCDPGHRPLQGRHDDQAPSPCRCPAPSRPLCVCCPGQHFDTLVIAPADPGSRLRRSSSPTRAFDSNDFFSRSPPAPRQGADRAPSAPRHPAPDRHRHVPMAPSDPQLLPPAPAVQPSRHARLQYRSELRVYQLTRIRRHFVQTLYIISDPRA